MKRKIIITVDYEIFGNGTGDVRQHVVGPTRRMEEIADKHGIPLIIFFELEEYLAFERHAELLRNQLGYSPAALMREQAQDLARGGHDIQLHLHPEWYEARLEDGRWRLGATRTVDDLFESQEETTRYIGERKAMLETLINLGKPDRKVQVYRAGAFAAQPGRKLLTALAENGISIDSSVVKGLVHGGKTERRKQKTEISKNTNSDGPALDYRDAPCAKGPWRVKDDVAREDKSGKIWEFPIYSVMRRRMHQATPRRLRAKFSGIVPKHRQKEMAHQLGLTANPFQMLRFLWQPVPIKLDFHNVSPLKLLKWIRSAPAPLNGEPDVIVLIGHTKEHIADRPFEQLLRLIKEDPALQVVSFSEVARLLPSSRERVQLGDVMEPLMEANGR